MAAARSERSGPRAASPATSTRRIASLAGRRRQPGRDLDRAVAGGCRRAGFCVIAGLRVGEDRPDRAFLDDAAGIDDRDPVGDRADHFHLVGDQQDGQAEPPVDVLQQRQDRARGFRIERRGRLVGEQQRRAGGQRAGDADALLLAARQRGGIGLRLLGRGRPGRAVRRARCSRSAFGRPSIFSGSATLSSTVLADSRLKCWKIMPMRRRSGCSSRSPSRRCRGLR